MFPESISSDLKKDIGKNENYQKTKIHSNNKYWYRKIMKDECKLMKLIIIKIKKNMDLNFQNSLVLLLARFQTSYFLTILNVLKFLFTK